MAQTQTQKEVVITPSKYVTLEIKISCPRTDISRIYIFTAPVTKTEFKGRTYYWSKVYEFYGKSEIRTTIPEGIFILRAICMKSRRYADTYTLICRAGNGLSSTHDTLEMKNAEVIEDIGEKLVEIETEMKNNNIGLARDPLKQLNNIASYIIVKTETSTKQELAVDTSDIEADSEELEISQGKVEGKAQSTIQDKSSLELEELELKPAPTPTPTPKKPELVKIYLLSMRLPSKYLVQKLEVSEGREVRIFNDSKERQAVASRLEGLRRTVYEKISRIFANVEELGVWIAVTDEAVKEAEKISKYILSELEKMPALRKLRTTLPKWYQVKAIPVYLEPEDAKHILELAIQHLSADVEDLRKKIKEAEDQKKYSLARRYTERMNYRLALIESFKKYLSQLQS